MKAANRSGGMDFMASMDQFMEEAPPSPDDTPRNETPAKAVTPPPPPPKEPEIAPKPDSSVHDTTYQTTPVDPTPKTEIVKKDDFEELEGSVQRLLDTPRTREAFLRSGLRKEELQVKSYQDFHVPGDLAEKQKLRFHHYETRRQEKLNMVLQERAKVIAEKIRQTVGGDTVNYQSLQMMEGLLDLESKRLEKSLRAQLRYHQSVELENTAQLEKEKTLTKKLVYRQDRQAVAKTQYDSKSKQLKEICDAKQRHSQELQEKNQQRAEADVSEHLAMIIKEQDRLEKWREEKRLEEAKRSNAYQEKCEHMRLRKVAEDEKKDQRGAEIMDSLAKKLQEIEKSKAEIVMQSKVRHEEESLKLVDAKDKIKRLQRRDEHRRDLIRENLVSQEERVDTLLHLRDQIVQQRKVRIKQQAVMKGRALNIKGNTPGPGHYQPLPGCMNEMVVPKISSSKPLNLQQGSTDMMIKLSKGVPPCGTYDPITLPNGNHLDWDVIDGRKTRIVAGTRPKKTFVDDNTACYEQNPGPGTYEGLESVTLKHSTRIVRDYIDQEGKPPTWCAPVTATPSPDEYTLDKFTKKGRVTKSDSAPALGRALQMTLGK